MYTPGGVGVMGLLLRTDICWPADAGAETQTSPGFARASHLRRVDGWAAVNARPSLRASGATRFC
jgi:hypothetical protein